MVLLRLALWLCPATTLHHARGIFSLAMLIVSIGVGIAWGMAIEGDFLFSALRSLPLTNTLNKVSSSEPLVYLLAHNSHGELIVKDGGDARPKQYKVTEAFVRVGLKDGVIYEGWPEFYSRAGENGQIYLSPACLTRQEDGRYISEKTPGPGVLVFNSEIRYVEFVDRAASSCYVTWFGSGVWSR